MAQGEASIRVYLAPEIKEQFKTTCFLKGLNMSDITAELIEDWLAQNGVNLTSLQTGNTSEQGKEPRQKV